ncbi:hypothetical protein [Ramlibacter sp. PS4R-6]|uniref:hypothetical protein n=1 Tax=Ramlibacter sp. PS4R-6 TaxID=3133438 RepID=UPI0030A3F6B8
MKKLNYIFVLLAFVLMGYSSGLRADDTDIYVSDGGTNGVPNVLLVIDTAASFSADASSCTFGTGGSPIPNGKAAGIEICALVDAINALPNGSVNIGIMTTNSNNYANDVRSTSDVAFHETCPSGAGGCLVRKLTLMNAANKANLINFIKAWDVSGQSSSTVFNAKASTSHTGGMMQEAWAYYNGKIGQSGKDYGGTSVLASGCQKNFIVFIGNAFGNSGTPGDGNTSPYSDSYGLGTAYVGASTAQKTKISENVVFSGPTCNAPTSALYASPQTVMVPSTNTSDWSENWADEWARYMYQQDGGTDTMQGIQNITTYTIGVLDPSNACKGDYPALLTTMAKYGGGKYFRTGNATEITTALETILNEVQAVNSVFSSASLPVSVNADGSYLNQIYLGMFRPDATGNPRWLGNLKQYHLVKNASGALVQGDSKDQPAINPTTGFISPTAVSFWTKNKDTSTLPDSAGGFWKNATASQGTLVSAYDNPDGEVVEKGGVGQQLRWEALTADYTANAQTTSNPRRLYTYCPTGSTCNASLTHSSNIFSTSNVDISSAAFGTSSTLNVASIVRTGTTALVTTSGNHGFTAGTTQVSISGASQSDYNVTQVISAPSSATTFTITGLPDYPTTPSTATYSVSSAASGSVNISAMSRSTNGGAVNTETLTVTTSAAHGFTTAQTLKITGSNPSDYDITAVPVTASGSTLTFNVTITPTATAQNVYQAQVSTSAYPSISNASLTNPSQGNIDGTTSTTHNLHVGQTVVVSNASDGNGSKYPGTFTVSAANAAAKTFSLTGGPTNLKNQGGVTATIGVDSTNKTIATLGRTTTTATTAKATGLPSGWFGAAIGDTKIVNITKASGTQPNETAYVTNTSNVTITCTTSGCTEFTYPITTSPSTPITATSATVGISGTSAATIGAGGITRSGANATATATLTAGSFTSGQQVTVSSASTLSTEAEYLGTWTTSSACSTIGGTCTLMRTVTQTPAVTATGTIKVYSGSTPPDRDTMIRWIRGYDNYGGENGPGGTITVRPSIHGDVLHSRPMVINYGDAARGIVVYYGANDGVFRAVNGNQLTGNINGVAPGGEIWGLVLPEHYGLYSRLRLNTPEIKFPSTILPSAQAKDYFVDGQTSSYQRLNSDGSGTISTAYIFLSMRRGGRFMYGLDVSQPASPSVMWKRSSADTGFEEMGQSWSRPRATILAKSGLGTANPVIIFGAGYDPAQDSEPPATNTMGRGIYIIKASDGSLVWSANSTCTTSATCRNVPGMKFAIPSDIAFVDRDGDGFTERLYFGDTGGNVWRADIAAADSADWTVTKLASLGCDDGAAPAPSCSDGKAPRKFFFPPSVLSIGQSGQSGAYDAVSIPSGDREHPLKNTAAGTSYGVSDRFFMINDLGSVPGTPVTSNVTLGTMANSTSTPYSGTTATTYPNGFYINFAVGEKGVNAPLATNGMVFFATNRPVDPDGQCKANLGEAKAYAVSPFLATTTTNLIVGGGLPPSPVAGLITVSTNNPNNPSETTEEKFCIGCAAVCTSCSSLENSPPVNAVPKNLKRTYWYKK